MSLGGGSWAGAGDWLARSAAEAGLTVMVCQFPPETSKRNPIDASAAQRDLGQLVGRPLVCHEVIVELIGAPTIRTGLRVQVELDRCVYRLVVKVSDAALAAVPLTQHN